MECPGQVGIQIIFIDSIGPEVGGNCSKVEIGLPLGLTWRSPPCLSPTNLEQHIRGDSKDVQGMTKYTSQSKQCIRSSIPRTDTIRAEIVLSIYLSILYCIVCIVCIYLCVRVCIYICVCV